MMGEDQSTGKMFSYVSAERRIPADHPLRPMRALVDEALKGRPLAFRGNREVPRLSAVIGWEQAQGAWGG